MKQKPAERPASSERIIRDIKRKTRKQYSAEEKIRIVLDGLRGEDSIAELCRREGIAQGTDKLTILRLRSGNTLPLSASNCGRNGASGP